MDSPTPEIFMENRPGEDSEAWVKDYHKYMVALGVCADLQVLFQQALNGRGMVEPFLPGFGYTARAKMCGKHHGRNHPAC